jgi:hypothetical protein
MNYAHKDEIISRHLWINLMSRIDLDYQIAETSLYDFTLLMSTTVPGDHFEVSVNEPVKISNFNFEWP